MDIATTSTTLLRVLGEDAQSARWTEFAAQYVPFMTDYLRAAFPTLEADDIVQEALIAVVKALPNYHYDPDAKGHFHNWLVGVVRNKANDALRKRAHDVAVVRRVAEKGVVEQQTPRTNDDWRRDAERGSDDGRRTRRRRGDAGICRAGGVRGRGDHGGVRPARARRRGGQVLWRKGSIRMANTRAPRDELLAGATLCVRRRIREGASRDVADALCRGLAGSSRSRCGHNRTRGFASSKADADAIRVIFIRHRIAVTGEGVTASGRDRRDERTRPEASQGNAPRTRQPPHRRRRLVIAR